MPVDDGGFLEWLLPRLPGPAELAAARAPRLPAAQARPCLPLHQPVGLAVYAFEASRFTFTHTRNYRS